MNRMGNVVDFIFLKTDSSGFFSSLGFLPTLSKRLVFLEFKKIFDLPSYFPQALETSKEVGGKGNLRVGASYRELG